jgi:hypothetical protein
MPEQQSQLIGWRAQVKGWLQAVQQYRTSYGVDLRTAATQHVVSFPRNLILVFVSQAVRALAVWLIKLALRDAAAGLGISLTDAELDVLADVAVSALAA